MFEDSYLPQKPELERTLDILDYVFCVAFTLEMLLKMTGLGISKYFASPWNCLDAFIVAVSESNNVLVQSHYPTSEQNHEVEKWCYY